MRRRGLIKQARPLIWLRVGSGGGFGGWGVGAVDFQTFDAAGKPVKSYQTRDSHHHTRELERLSRITQTPVRIKQTGLELGDGARITCNNVKLVTTVLETGKDSFICLRIYTFFKKYSK